MSDLESYRRASPRARLGVGAAIVLALVALAATVGIGIWRSASRPALEVPPAAVSAGPTPSAGASAEMYVHVSGAVREAGLYVVEPGGRVIDAVSAAGGLADDADADAINLARPLADGEQLVVPREGEAPAAPAEGGDAPGAVLVNLNTAEPAQLETLTGIGPALAQRIIEWRDSEGPFGSVDDLLAVSGIGPKVLESLRDQVTV
ncbi:MAG TPA: helix-hairpin-helix domain-containing protein [Microbacterium sp.]|nr:helix-hairpin-helix domain-containing protein [Microbacterium sp.]